jgi:hypothetical protein
LILVDASRLKGAAPILSLLLFIFSSYEPLRPMNLKKANESLNIIVASKGATGPQKLHHWRNRVGGQLMNLNVVSSKYVSKLLRYRQPKHCREKILEHNALILPGFRCCFFATQPTDPRLKATL